MPTYYRSDQWCTDAQGNAISGAKVYVTSQPIHPRVVDYYFSLVPELDTPEARSRFLQVSLCDGRNETLARKLLERPGAIRKDDPQQVRHVNSLPYSCVRRVTPRRRRVLTHCADVSASPPT